MSLLQRITRALMAPVSAGRVLGRAVGAGSGDPTEMTPDQIMAVLATSATPPAIVTPATVIKSDDLHDDAVEGVQWLRMASAPLAAGTWIISSITDWAKITGTVDRMRAHGHCVVVNGVVAQSFSAITLLEDDSIVSMLCAGDTFAIVGGYLRTQSGTDDVSDVSSGSMIAVRVA